MSKQTVRSDAPTAYTVEQRMSKVFTLEPGGAGSASISVQSPDAVDRNLAFASTSESASGAVQSPDAADRNLALAMAIESLSGAVQSPDAIERNLVHIDGSHLAPTYGDGDLPQ